MVLKASVNNRQYSNGVLKHVYLSRPSRCPFFSRALVFVNSFFILNVAGVTAKRSAYETSEEKRKKQKRKKNVKRKSNKKNRQGVLKNFQGAIFILLFILFLANLFVYSELFHNSSPYRVFSFLYLFLIFPFLDFYGQKLESLQLAELRRQAKEAKEKAANDSDSENDSDDDEAAAAAGGGGGD